MTKRTFLLRTALAATAACVWEPLVSFSKPEAPAGPRRLSLAGQWQVCQQGKSDWLPAAVPGCVHTDLLAAGKIPDPFYRDNEKAVQWVGEAGWTYQRAFEVPAEALKNDRVLLRCEGLDTLATLKINGREIGRADNMFRLWEFDVKAALRPGRNTLEIFFRSSIDYIKERSLDKEPNKWIRDRAWIRKEPCSFGWDWGPVLPSCGVWRPISLETFNQGRLLNVQILQDHQCQGKVALEVQANVESLPGARPFKAAIAIFDQGRKIASTTADVAQGQGRGRLEISQPKLWWPRGMGQQPLYEVRVDLFDSAGKLIDSSNKRVGLRTLTMELPKNGSALQFVVNGLPFFAKGANCIPADSFPNRVSPATWRRYIADAAAVNMNMLRFWGGGYYEDDVMFDACDELGICVWLDFKFACYAYPAFDPDFFESVRQEAKDNVQRLHHHPCIAVWCGNNELTLFNVGDQWGGNVMSRADYSRLFKEMLAQQVQTYSPQSNYVSGSPECGDTHYWDVWHGPKLFEAYRTQSGFMSEFGYQSFPEPKTVRAFTSEEDRASVVTPVMKWHQRSGGNNCNQKMVDAMKHYFKAPKDFDSTLWLSQILQGYGIKLGAEYWRQTMPKAMGCVFWQYNDTWPGMSWSSVDYFGRWKALHYLARRFYEPLLVSGLEDMEKGAIDLFVSSDRLEACQGTVSWKVTDLQGKSILTDSMTVEIAPRQSQKIKTLSLSSSIGSLGKNQVLTWLKLTVSGKVVSENLVFLALPKELELSDPQLATSVKAAKGGFEVTLQAQKPALWAWLNLEDADAHYSDNFVHLTPDAPVRIMVQPWKKLTQEAFTKMLRVQSLYDTYSVRA